MTERGLWGPACPGQPGGMYGSRIGCGARDWHHVGWGQGFVCIVCNAHVNDRLMTALCVHEAKWLRPSASRP